MNSENADIKILGLSSQKEKQFLRKEICTLGDLLRFFPRRYEDLSRIVPIRDLSSYVGEKVTIIGSVRGIRVDYAKQYVRISVVPRSFEEGSDGDEVGVFFFRQMFMQNRYPIGGTICIYGRVSEKNGFVSIAPEFHTGNPADVRVPLPVYRKIPGMADAFLRRCIGDALDLLAAEVQIRPDAVSDLPDNIRAGLSLDSALTFFRRAHFPTDKADLEAVQLRQDVETLEPVVRGLVERERLACRTTDKVADSPAAVAKLRETLPYPLTPDQEKVVDLMTTTMASGQRLDLLLQADVGAGKTVCAALAIANAIASGYQAVIMAPTSVLAEQHYAEFSQYFPEKTVLLAGKMAARSRKKVLQRIADGDASVVVGTIAAISDDVVYSNLGLTVVDEEHRFGVDQRNALRRKAESGAHFVSMTATPIPRSLALAVYGGCQVFDIHTMPPGRKPVQTFIRRTDEVVFRAIGRQVAAGHQAYVVCPAIEGDSLPDVDTIEVTQEKLEKFFAGTDVKIGCIHGNMKALAIEKEIRRFSSGEIDILLSTTIVEVGINIPNATVMVIKNAERFGLAQLHQLRGRVGRSSDQGYCVLVSEKDTPRLQAMIKTTDGFEIAKEDLALRGSGNLIGTAQSGMDRAVELISARPDLYRKVRTLIESET